MSRWNFLQCDWCHLLQYMPDMYYRILHRRFVDLQLHHFYLPGRDVCFWSKSLYCLRRWNCFQRCRSHIISNVHCMC